MAFHTKKSDAERKPAGEALIESEERLRLALSTAEMGTWRWDAVADLDTRDAVLNQMLGLDAVESTQPNSDFLERIHPDDRSAAETELKRSIHENDMCKAVFRIIQPDGTIRWFQDQSRSFFNEKGEHMFSTGVVRDITDFRQMEEARNQAQKELEAHRNRLAVENIYLKEEIQTVQGFEEIVGKSNALLYVLSKVEQVAKTDSTALVQGETGVGKELISRAIHQTSLRSEQPFVKVNCAALPVNLVESELFGHESGAFTSANRLRQGRFELADGGTIFLDEISELPLEVQAKLLGVLQERKFERVGGSKTLSVDVRIIAATNRNLTKEMAAGRFRTDLFYRLNVFPITVPPLRNRREDIPLLVEHFVAMFAKQIGKTIDRIPQSVMDELIGYDWPGNVRELCNIVERAVIACPTSNLCFPIKDFFEPLEPDEETADPQTDLFTLEEVERRHILKALKITRWRISGAEGTAKILDINPSTLRNRMKKLGIRRN